MPTKSKGFRRFKSRIEFLQDDLETLEILFKNRERLAKYNAVFIGVTESEYPRLSKRQSTPSARYSVIGHLRGTLYVSVIKELYEEVLSYCSYIADCAALMSPQAVRLVGAEDCTFTANEILSKNNREDIVKMVMNEVFRKIENKKNTLFLISAVNDRLNLGVSEETISDAIPYLDARHKFVHADGYADELFKKKYPNVELYNTGQIKLNKTIIKKVFSLVIKLVTEYEDKMTELNLFPETEFQ